MAILGDVNQLTDTNSNALTGNTLGDTGQSMSFHIDDPSHAQEFMNNTHEHIIGSPPQQQTHTYYSGLHQGNHVFVNFTVGQHYGGSYANFIDSNIEFNPSHFLGTESFLGAGIGVLNSVSFGNDYSNVNNYESAAQGQNVRDISPFEGNNPSAIAGSLKPDIRAGQAEERNATIQASQDDNEETQSEAIASTAANEETDSAPPNEIEDTTDTPQNLPPIANSLRFSDMNEDTASRTYSFSATDHNGDALTYSLNSQPDYGSVTLNGGSFTFFTEFDFQDLPSFSTRSVTFSYTTTDIFSLSSSASITIVVTGLNDIAEARPDTAAITENTNITVNVLANDIDPE